MLLSVARLAANVNTALRVRTVTQRTGSRALLVNEVAGSAAVVVLVLLPWVLGGIDPTRSDLTWAILVSFAAAVASLFVLVLSIFGLAGGRKLPTASARGGELRPLSTRLGGFEPPTHGLEVDASWLVRSRGACRRIV